MRQSITGAVVSVEKGEKTNGNTNGEEYNSALDIMEHFTADVTFVEAPGCLRP